MQVTMVKKILADGSPCKKCGEAWDKLVSMGLDSQIDRILEVQEAHPGQGEGAALAARFQVDRAPFFVVNRDGEDMLVLSVMQLIRKVLEPRQQASVAFDVDEAQDTLERETPQNIIRFALEKFGADCGISFSGAEDVALIHMAAQTGLPFSVFSLDTGRLHEETVAFLERVRTTYDVDLEVFFPEAGAVERLTRNKGLFSFFDDGHKECCGIRKVEPLKRALSTRKAWITGQREDQNPATRTSLPVVQEDPAFKGASEILVKFNPLSHWSSAQVWDYLREEQVPTNSLHEQGFRSIGCAPCTRAVRPEQHEREGRWWWEDASKKECGLHVASNAPGKTDSP
jgi:phosphoadenosine phosphosulfate reductase